MKNTKEHIRLLERLVDWWNWNGEVVKMKDRKYTLSCLTEQYSGEAKMMMTCWNQIREDGKCLWTLQTTLLQLSVLVFGIEELEFCPGLS